MTSLLSTTNDDAPPNWVGVLGLLLRYGVGSAIAVFLVWWLTQDVDKQLAAVAAGQHATHAVVEKHVEQQTNDQKIQRALLVAICRNTARTAEGRESCEVGR